MNNPLAGPGTGVAKPRRRQLTCGLLLAAGTTLLMACTGGLLPKSAPPPARFTLDLGKPESAARSAVAGAPVLTVDLPSPAPGYDSSRMVYLRRPHEIEAFAFHEWVATPAHMLMPLLVRALQDSGAFRVVLAAPTAAEAGWRLQTDSLRLFQDFTVRPNRVRLTVRAVLLDGAARQALTWREFDISVNAAGEDPVSGAAAAQAAAEQLGAAIAVFCAQQVHGTKQPKH